MLTKIRHIVFALMLLGSFSSYGQFPTLRDTVITPSNCSNSMSGSCVTGTGSVEVFFTIAAPSYPVTISGYSINGPTFRIDNVVDTATSATDTLSYLIDNLCYSAISPYFIFVNINGGPGSSFLLNFFMPGKDKFSVSESVFDESCLNSGDGSVDLSITDGNKPFSVSWGHSPSTDSSLTGLSPGNYFYDIVDATGCSESDSINIQPGPVFDAGFTFNPDPACFEEPVAFTDTSIGTDGGTSYSWDFGTDASPASSNATSPSNITYSSTGNKDIELIIDNGSCTDTATASITVDPKPIVTITNDTTICIGATLILESTGGTTYAWDNSSTLSDTTSATPTASPLITTRYRVVVMNASGCSDTTSVLVTVASLPTITLTPDSTICFGDTIQLVATGGTQYSWTPSGLDIINDPNIANPFVYPTADTTYWVTVQTGASCIDSASVQISVNPLPVVSISNDTTYCNGEDYQLTASGGINYNWSPVTGLTNPSIPNPIANPISTTTYNVEVTTGAGCLDSADVTITVNNPPIVTVSNDTSICIGDSAQLIASGADNYDWTPNTNLTVDQIANPLAFPTSDQSYQVIGTDINGCQDTNNVSITVNSLPTVTTSGDATICLNDTSSLSANGGISYSWTPTDSLFTPNAQNTDANPSTTTTYMVSVTDINGCIDTSSLTITVNPLPIATTNGDRTICLNDTTDLIANGGTTYSWTPTDSLFDPNNSTTLANPSTTTQYTVLVGDANNCESTANLTVTVNPLPAVNITTPSDSICEGDTIILTATGASTYTWSGPSILGANNTPAISINPTTDALYTVIGQDLNGCILSVDQTIIVNPAPTSTISPNDTICSGDTITLAAGGGTTFNWNGSDIIGATNGATIDVNPSTDETYVVTVSDAIGCTSKDSVDVIVNNLPTITITPKTDTICVNDTATFSAVGAPNFQWVGSTIIGPSNTSNIQTNPVSSGIYVATGTDINGCSVTDTANIVVNALPILTISPNDTICLGESSTLTAGGATSYFWSGASITTGTNQPSIDATPIGTSKYSVEATDLNGCSDTISTNIIVNNLPSLSVSPSDTICFGDTTAITASGASTYNWFKGSNIIAPSNTSNISVHPGITDTFYVEGTDNSGCIDTASVTVFVYTIPTLSISNDTSICIGDTAILSASGGASYSWTGSNIILPINTPSVSVIPSNSQTYIVEVGDGSGCTDTAMVDVTVHSLPNISTSSDLSTICALDTVELYAAGADSFIWTGTSSVSNPTNDTTQSTPSNNASYIAFGTDMNGCSNSDTISITVNALPVVTTSPDDTICIGETVSICANGGSTYLWNASSNINDNSAQCPLVTPMTDTTFVVTAFNGAGCSDTGFVNIIVNQLPTININSPVTICKTDTAQLSAEGGGIYAWSPTTNLDDPASATPKSIDTVNTSYKVIVTSPQGCIDSAFTQVIVDTIPNLTTSGDTAICLNDTILIQAFGGQTYSWSPAGILSDPTNDSTLLFTTTDTTLIVRGELGSGCFTFDTMKVTVKAIPSISVSGIDSICVGESTTLTATNGLDAYLWTPTDSLSDTTNFTTTASPTSTTTYWVKGFNAVGCSDSANITVKVNTLPIIAIHADRDTICSGETTQLHATPGFTNYAWTGGPLTSPNDSLTDISPTIDANYQVVVTNQFGCSDSATKLILIDPVITIDVAENDTICIGDSITLTATVINGVDFRWEPASIGGIVSPDNLTTRAQPTGTTIYSLTVTNSIGCQNTDSITVFTEDYPTISIAGTDSICTGDTATLFASGGTSYEWSPISSGGILSRNNDTTRVTPNSTTTYQVIARSLIGCADSLTHDIFVDPIPNPITSIDTSICFGDSVTIIASGGTNYSWNNPTSMTAPLNDTTTVFPTSTTTYTVTAFNTVGCSDTATITIGINNLPITSITSASDTICSGDTTTLTATGGTNYAWTGTPSVGATNQASLDVNPIVNTFYNVIVTDIAGCSSSDSFLVVSTPLPGTITSPGDTLCIGDTISLSSSGGVSFNWSGTNILTDNGFGTITANPIATDTFTVTIRDANGCFGFDSSFVHVNPLPTTGISLPDTICLRDTSMLIASGGNAYAWSGDSIIGTSNNDSLLAAPRNDSRYFVTVTDSNGCTNLDSTTITVNALPNLSTSSTDTICLGESTTLTASGATDYTWTGSNIISGANTNNILVNPIVSQKYLLIGANSSGCSDTASVTVIVIDPPITSNLTNDTICIGDTATLNITGGISWNWTGANILTGNGTTSISANPTITSKYIVETIGEGNCSTFDSATIVINALPVISLSEPDTLCEGDTVAMVATGGSIYKWSGQNILSADTANTITAIPTSGQETYQVIVTNENNCSSTDSITNLVNARPNLTVSGDTAICLGDSTTLTAIAPSGTNFIWSPMDSLKTPNQSVTIASPGSTTDYSVTVTDLNNCNSMDTVSITVNTLPNILISSDTSICSGESINLFATGGTNFLWTSTDTGLIESPDSNITVAFPTSSTIYNVQVRDSTGCTGFESVSVTVDVPPGGSLTADMDTVCFGSPIRLTASLDTGFSIHPLGSYSFDNGTSFSSINTNTFTQGNGGDTSVCAIIRDQFGCNIPSPICISVHTLDPIGYEIDTISFPECTGPPGEFRLHSIVGGLAPYQVSFNGGDTIATQDTIFKNLLPGSYALAIQDNFGCNSFDVLDFNSSIVFDTVISAPICAGDTNGQIEISNITGGVRPYQFSVGDSLNYGIDSVFNGLSAGSHLVYVKDATGCVVQLLFELIEPGALTVTETNHQDIICAGDKNGEIELLISGGTVPFNITLDTLTQSGNDIFTYTNLGPGNYSIDLIDALSCRISYPFTIKAADSIKVNITQTVSPSGCNESDGQATITQMQGGNGELTFSYTSVGPFRDSLNFENDLIGLSGGLYQVFIRDNFCVDTLNFTITSGGGIELDSIQEEIFSPTCTGGDGEVTLSNVFGAPPTYFYELREALPIPDKVIAPYQLSPSFTGLNEGNFYISIKDGLDCEYKYFFNIGPRDQIVIEDILMTPESCNAGNGSIEIVASGGTPPLKYSITGEDDMIENLNVYPNLVADRYRIRVQDGVNPNCVVGFDTTLTGNSIDVALQVTPALCPNSNDGQVEIVKLIDADTVNFAFEFAIGADKQFSDSLTFTNVAQGYDTLWIRQIEKKSSLFCDYPDVETYFSLDTGSTVADTVTLTSFFIGAPDTLFAEVFTIPSEKEGADGALWINNVSGGTAPYRFSLGDTSDFINNSTIDEVKKKFSGLPPGEYTVVVMDTNGCIRSFQNASIGIKFYIPNIFTPNGDGANDVFFIHSLPPNTMLRVYDRWGNQVYWNNSYDNTWDGDRAWDGTYFYEVSNHLGTFKGWVQIVR